jgi:putative ABC transport system permease protein
MNLLYIAYRNLLQRGVASALTMLSMALGVGLVVAVLTIYGAINQSFQMSNSVGYNLLIGAKGGDLQMTLNSIYFLGRPVENVNYHYFLEFYPAAVRKEAYENSLARQRSLLAQGVSQPQLDASLQVAVPGFAGVAQSALLKLAEENCHARKTQVRDGEFAFATEKAVPLCLGDYLGNYRAVATTPELFKDRMLDPRYDTKFTFKEGRNFQQNSKEFGYFEAILGAAAARELKLKVGDTFQINHGEPTGHEHENLFHIVGILDRSGTPNDRAAFVNIEGFLLMNDHAKPVAENITEDDKTLFDESKPKAPATDPEATQAYIPLPVEEREVTAFLVRTSDPTLGGSVTYLVNKGNVARAVSPIREIEGLFQTFLSPIRQVLLLLTVMICIVAGISILVSIYNSMNERKRDIAVMRALGARRAQVMSVILFESVFIAFLGAITGFVVAHLLIFLFSTQIEAQTGVYIGLQFAPAIPITMSFGIWPELLIIPALVILAILAGLFPAMSAYRTDVSKSLQS